jgi:hypothetical protein
MGTTGRMTTVLAVIAIVGVVTTGTAQAGPIRTSVEQFKAQQTAPGTVKYSGKIKTTGTPKRKRERCLRNRLVEIYHDGVLIATTNTDADGEFSIDGPEPPSGDKVKVVVTSRTKCKAASDTITYRAPQAP